MIFSVTFRTFCLVAFCISIPLVYANSSLTLETLYGTHSIQESVIIDLINDPHMQRLKKLNQFGVDYYTFKPIPYTRYTHSIGVFILARRYGASLREQIASLLHDISHTAFSHVADFMFKVKNRNNSYQDEIHEQFISHTSLRQVLEQHGFTVHDIIHKDQSFTILEQELPDICADRLEYNLHQGFLEGFITQADIDAILDSLKFEEGRWFFTNVERAEQFARLPLYFTEHRWTSPGSTLRNTWASQALKRAVALELISLHDVLYGTDDELWSKLNSSNDEQIQELMHKLYHYEAYFVLDEQQHDIIFREKFRGIDPWIRIASEGHVTYQRLTQVSRAFHRDFYRLKQRMQQGWCIRFTKPLPSDNFTTINSAPSPHA